MSGLVSWVTKAEQVARHSKRLKGSSFTDDCDVELPLNMYNEYSVYD